MALKLRDGLPPPPTDLARRKLSIRQLNGPIFRIHRTGCDCLHFGKSNSGRFDDPLRQYGVLYAALRPEAAFAEVFLRRLSLMLVCEMDLQERSISEIHCKQLRCVDLAAAGLRKVSCDNRIATETPYRTIGQWSRAFFTHPQQPDGIIYRSRHNPQFKCLALFDRCRRKLKVVASQALMSGSRRAWSVAQVEKYKLAIEPGP